MNEQLLSSWRDGDAKRSVTEFVDQTCELDVPVEERVAVFDNDGTLWCEKPMPIQLDFILRRLGEMVVPNQNSANGSRGRRSRSVISAGSVL